MKMAATMGALAQAQVMLSVPDFIRYISGVEGEKLAHCTAATARHLPGIYNRLAVDPNLGRVLRQNMFRPQEGLPSSELRKYAANVAETHSVDIGRIRDRVYRSVLRQVDIPPQLLSSEAVKTAAADEPGEYLARQYAIYKVAFLASQPAEVQESQLTLRVAVLQNYITSN